MQRVDPMTKVIVIHGTKGSPAINWFPWLSAELRTHGIECIVPAMPTPEGQELENWLAAFHKQVGAIDSSTIVVGHSVGATFLLRLLERIKFPIKASLFVAGLIDMIGIPEYDKLNSSFIAGAYDWQTIKRNAGKIICLSGDNDPYVPKEQGETMVKNLGVEQVVIEKGGHLNAESGYTEFPLLLEKLQKELI